MEFMKIVASDWNSIQRLSSVKLSVPSLVFQYSRWKLECFEGLFCTCTNGVENVNGFDIHVTSKPVCLGEVSFLCHLKLTSLQRNKLHLGCIRHDSRYVLSIGYRQQMTKTKPIHYFNLAVRIKRKQNSGSSPFVVVRAKSLQVCII